MMVAWWIAYFLRSEDPASYICDPTQPDSNLQFDITAHQISAITIMFVNNCSLCDFSNGARLHARPDIIHSLSHTT